MLLKHQKLLLIGGFILIAVLILITLPFKLTIPVKTVNLDLSQVKKVTVEYQNGELDINGTDSNTTAQISNYLYKPINQSEINVHITPGKEAKITLVDAKSREDQPLKLALTLPKEIKLEVISSKASVVIKNMQSDITVNNHLGYTYLGVKQPLAGNWNIKNDLGSMDLSFPLSDVSVDLVADTGNIKGPNLPVLQIGTKSNVHAKFGSGNYFVKAEDLDGSISAGEINSYSIF